MNIAILGFQSLGRKVFEILTAKKSLIYRNYDINISYIFITDNNIQLLPQIATNNYSDILNDTSIDLIIDTLENVDSFEYVKMALYSSKHVITISSNLIAKHYVELEAIAIDMHVKLLFSGSVLPTNVIYSLLSDTSYNGIKRIDAILDDDINNLLSLMTKDNLSFDDAKNIASLDKNIEELEKNAKDKLAIISMISFDTTINVDEIYTYSIKTITDDFILVANLLGYKIKYMGEALLNQSRVNAMIEPVLIKSNDLFANVDNRLSAVRYYGEYIDSKTFCSKSNILISANEIISDIRLVLSDYRQKFMPRNSYICNGNRHILSKYLIRPKVMNDYFRQIAEKNLDKIIVTEPILGEELLEHLSEILFYARIID